MDDTADPLTRFAIARGTDKYGLHRYTPHYHRWLAPFRDRAITLLEIGVGGYDDPRAGGASLRMWRDYFPCARIVGVDLYEKRLDDMAGVALRTGSAAEPAFVAALAAEFGGFDVVVDDGSHVSAHVIAAFALLFPHLADGGLYIVEDTAASYWPGFGGGEGSRATSMNFAKTLFDAVDDADRRERPSPSPARDIRTIARMRNLLVIEKGRNDDPATAAGVAPERAVAAYEALAPAGDDDAVLMLAQLLQRAGRPDEALARLEARLAAVAATPRLLVAAARLAAATGALATARRHARRAMAEAGDDLAPFVAAAETAGLADLVDPARFAAAVAAGTRSAQRLVEAGMVRRALGDGDGAARDFSAALEAGGPVAARRLDLVAGHFVGGGDLARAAAAFARAVAASPYDADLAVRHAALLYRRGDADGAEAEVDRALAVNPLHPRALRLRANLLEAAGRTEEAFAAYRSAAAAIVREAGRAKRRRACDGGRVRG